MSKIYLLQVLFVIVEVLAFIPLTMEVFGGMNPDVIVVCALVMGIGLIGSGVCAIVRVARGYQRKDK